MTFEQWLMERGARTCMGAGQPPAAGSAQLPPLAHAAANPGHINSILTLHNDHPELLNPELKKYAKKTSNGKQKDPWAKSFNLTLK